MGCWLLFHGSHLLCCGSSMTSKESIAVFGSTGSIGTSTLDVLERNHTRYKVAALTANTDVDTIFAQCLKFQPSYAAMGVPSAAAELARRLAQAGCATQVLDGPDAMTRIAVNPDIAIVMAAIVGFAGLPPTLAAAQCGKRILLANKESMVVAGDLLTQAAKQGGASIVPVDSEHNAIFQCLPESNRCSPDGGPQGGVSSLVLTASGGPFRQLSLEQMQSVSVDQALNHPNWSMGPKISVDSATMMNKGLEVIEASYLFDIDESLIEVVVHPESFIHSMVRYIDGSVLAQLGQADMRTPIAHALAWPDRIEAGVEPIDFIRLGSMHFEAPDHTRFPCLALARRALKMGGSAPGVLNAANEIAVQEFLEGRIGFVDIAKVNSHVLQQFESAAPESVEDLFSMDQSARKFALDYIEHEASKPVA